MGSIDRVSDTVEILSDDALASIVARIWFRACANRTPSWGGLSTRSLARLGPRFAVWTGMEHSGDGCAGDSGRSRTRAAASPIPRTPAVTLLGRVSRRTTLPGGWWRTECFSQSATSAGKSARAYALPQIHGSPPSPGTGVSYISRIDFVKALLGSLPARTSPFTSNGRLTGPLGGCCIHEMRTCPPSTSSEGSSPRFSTRWPPRLPTPRGRRLGRSTRKMCMALVHPNRQSRRHSNHEEQRRRRVRPIASRDSGGRASSPSRFRRHAPPGSANPASVLLSVSPGEFHGHPGLGDSWVALVPDW